MTADSKGGFPKSDYKEYPKTLAIDDFWGQVRRTVHGEPVREEQIQMIVRAVRRSLNLRSSDVLLDLACGNGALSRYLFGFCQALVGIDHSEYLINVAKANFERPPEFMFACHDGAQYVASEAVAERFTKALCYGSFSFFSATDAFAVLDGLRRRFTRLRRLYLGNLPDKSRATNFYPPGTDFACELEDHTAQIGIWRTEEEMQVLAASAGWTTRFLRMPPAFFGAHYRYDVVLKPRHTMAVANK